MICLSLENANINPAHPAAIVSEKKHIKKNIMPSTPRWCRFQSTSMILLGILRTKPRDFPNAMTSWWSNHESANKIFEIAIILVGDVQTYVLNHETQPYFHQQKTMIPTNCYRILTINGPIKETPVKKTCHSKRKPVNNWFIVKTASSQKWAEHVLKYLEVNKIKTYEQYHNSPKWFTHFFQQKLR